MKIQTVLALPSMMILAACVSSGGSNTLTAPPADLASTAYVREVELAVPPANGSDTFKEVFVQRVSGKMKTCATGTRPLRLAATISEFKRANPAVTVLVTDANVIKGTARLYDAETNAPLGEFEIARSFRIGGLMGAAIMAQAEEQMSSAFGDEVCKRAFGK